MIVWNIILTVVNLLILAFLIFTFIIAKKAHTTSKQNTKAILEGIGPELDKVRNEFKKVWSKL